MKKQTILFSVTAIILIIAFLSIIPRLLTIVMFFLLAGVIPGTSHTISAGVMFVISAGLFGFVTSHLIARFVFRRLKPSNRTVSVFTDNLPLKRFHQF